MYTLLVVVYSNDRFSCKFRLCLIYCYFVPCAVKFMSDRLVAVRLSECLYCARHAGVCILTMLKD